MYSGVLLIHSWLRWIALVAVVGVTLAAVRNQVAGDRSIADRWGLVAMMALDFQMLLGLLLYFALSPFTSEALQNFSAAMKNPQLRFWAVEHTSSMFAAVILAHVGRALARKARTPSSKRTRLLVCFGLATLLVMLGMPWPGLPNGRPLFRL
jgi:heme A synthase